MKLQHTKIQISRGDIEYAGHENTGQKSWTPEMGGMRQ